MSNTVTTTAVETGDSSAFRVPHSALAIVGLGCLFPKATGPGFYWANVKNGVDCITEVPPTHWDPEDYFDPDPKAPDMTYARRGGFLSAVEFNPMEFGIAPRDLEATDTSQLLGLVAAKQALTDAGIRFANQEARRAGGVSPPRETPDETDPQTRGADAPRPPKPVDRDRVSVILGVTGTLELVIPLGARLGQPRWKRAMQEAGVPADVAEDAAGRIADSYVPWQENSFPGLLGNVVAGRIANKLDLGGTNCVVDAACASSLSAVHLAALELQAGRADVAVTGGIDTFNDIFMYMCFSKTPALSATGDAKPFDATGDGTILGEGLGVAVLKRLADAERDGDTIYAVLKGIGSSSDGKGNAIYAPSPAGQKKCLQNAYALAGVTPDTIELVEAHGTGTRVGDTAEITALTEVFSANAECGIRNAESKTRESDFIPHSAFRIPQSKPWCALGSVKSQIGHTKAAAGAASLIKTVLALHNKVLPPTIKVSQPVEPLRAPDSPFYVNTTMRPWLPRPEHPRRAALSAFGFGGSNFHAVLEEYQPRKAAPDWDGTVEVVALSADTPQELVAELDRLPTSDWDAFARAAEASRSSFRPDAPCRLTFAACRYLTDLAKLVGGAKANLQSDPSAGSWHTPDGAHFGTGPAPGKLGVLFPGQGSQYVGMLRDLSCLFPEALDTLAAANEAVLAQSQEDTDTRRLSDRVYPPSTFDPDVQKANDRELRDTRNAQPAIGAVSFGAWRVLHDRFGVAAGAFAGHSYGELVALAAAGWIGPGDLFALSRLRGQLMARQRDGDPGSMLAVLAPPADIERVLAGQNLNLVVANKNAPKQTVLSGATAEVERAAPAFAAAGLKSARLPVAAAFHSEFVADAAGPFRAALDGVAFGPGSVPVFANTTAAEYPADAPAAKDLLANQLARPVAFVDEIRAMAAAGVRTFVEVGPGSVLARLVDAVLADAGVAGAEVFALDSSGGKRSCVLELGDVIARLSARGVWVRLTAWEEDSRCRPPAPSPTRPGLTVPICGANHVTPRAKRPPRSVPAHGQHNGSTRNAERGTRKAEGDPVPSFENGTRNGEHDSALRAPHSALRADRVPAVKVHPMSDANTAGPADPNALAQALLMTQQSLAALQRMQEQTAQLHRQFLESQEAAQRTLQTLVDQQQSLLLSGLGAGRSLPAMPAIPVPVVPPPAVVPTPVPAAERLAPVPAPVGPVPRPAPKPPAPAKAPAVNHVAGVLLGVVADKTGYPVSSLDLKLSLDTDLGVDSIKRVEILSALQEKLPGAPQVKPEHLGTLHTLQDVADFLGGGTAAVGTTTDASLEETQTDDELSRTMPVKGDQLTLLSRGDVPPAGPDGHPGLAAEPGKVDVAGVLLGVVADKTGYPVSSLDLKLSLDTDLGVDSIKRVEILSALQEKLPGAPQVKPEHLGTLHTLQDVADFLGGRSTARPEGPPTAKIPFVPPVPPFPLPEPVVRPAGAAATAPARAVTPPPGPAELSAPDTEHVSAIRPPKIPDSVLLTRSSDSRVTTSAHTRPVHPPETARHPVAPGGGDRIDRSILQTVDLDPGTPRPRLSLPAGGEVWVVGDPDGLAEPVADRLAHHGLNARVMGWPGPGTNRPAGPLAGLVLIAPVAPGPESGLNRLAFEWLQQVGPKLRQAGRHGAAVFATVARLDGAFGLNKLSPEADPTAGGLAGLVKTVRHEWPEVTCKAIDLDAGFGDPAAAAAAVVDEVLTAGPVEVGVAATHRCALELARTVRRPGSQSVGFGAKDVVLVTGGARGVTAEAAVALAETFGPTLVLTGRTPPPGPEPEWLVGVAGEPELKKAIADKLGPDANPRQIGEQYLKVTAQREVRRTLKRIEEVGARVAYFPIDVADGKAVADLLHQVRVKFGPVTALVHGAGVLADRRVEDLSGEDFDRVYSTKVDGLRNLLDLLAHEELKALVLFSSVTARFGRTGQLAYAVANEVLNKTAQVEARRRPGCRVVSVNWGPWEGGMVNLVLRKQFESEGLGLISLADGAGFMVHELNAAGKAVEVLALGKPRPGGGSGVIPVPGSGVTAVPGASVTGTASLLPAGGPPASPPTPAPNPDLIPAFERTMDVESHPILKSHVIDGRAVLPMALHVEFLAHAALHGHPGLVFHGFNDLRITQAVKLDTGEAVQLRAYAGKAVKQDKQFVVQVELRAKRKDAKEVVKSRADIVLAAALPKAPAADRPPAAKPYPYSVGQAYREFLFHGPDLHGMERIDGAGEVAFLGAANPAPPPADWFQYPLRSGWITDPLVLDVSFQMMCLWSRHQHGAVSLPNFAGRYRQFRRHFPDGGPVAIVIRITRDNGTFARADIDYLDTDGQVVAQLQDYECIIEKSLNLAFRRNQIGAVKA